jgi:hypothetical protein
MCFVSLRLCASLQTKKKAVEGLSAAGCNSWQAPTHDEVSRKSCQGSERTDITQHLSSSGFPQRLNSTE